MADVREAWQFLEQSDLIAEAGQVEAAIARLAGEIESRYRERYPLVLAAMNGAAVFAGQLLPRLRFPLDFDCLHLGRYGVGVAGGDVRWRVDPDARVSGREVLVLDDILDGGETMAAVRDALLARGAAAFACAVLVDKRLAREKALRADFVGLEVPDRFVFGCGMDAKGLWRNLPEIRAMRGR